MTVFKKFVALVLSFMMIMGTVGVAAFASEAPEANETPEAEEAPVTLWYGDDLSVDITSGTEGYTFMSLFRKPAHGYEFSGHFMGEGEGPQTFVIVDTVEHGNTTWKPDGKYVSGESNYEVVYCCDVETMIKDGAYYKRLNLEDSEYYNEEMAAKLRAIVTNSYPYVSMEEMKADLKANGYQSADDLKIGEVIAAVQTAIWACANTNGEPIRYAKSYCVTDNYQWGQPLHDVSGAADLDVSGKRVFKTYEEVGKRIDSLVDYLLTKEDIHADTKHAVVTGLEIVDFAPVMAKDGVYTVVVNVKLNHSGREDDNLKIDLSVNGEVSTTTDVVSGTTEYTLTVEAKAGETIKAVVSGEQYLNTGVYFYAPKPEDTNGDGIATSREVSQNLVGIAGGKTPIYSEASVTLDLPKPISVTGTLNLKKVNWKGEALAGAGFDLYLVEDDSSFSVGQYLVDAEGSLTVENLVPGKYELVESIVPTGFAAPEEAIRFEIDEEGNLTVEESELVSFENGVVVVENRLLPTDITLEGIKYLDDEVAPGFRFTLDYAGNQITVESDENGIIDFGKFFFDEEGTYVFVIKEIIDPENEDILYDKSVYTVTVEVTAEGTQLITAVSVEKDGEAHEDQIRFDNYTVFEIPDDPIPQAPPTGDNTGLLVLLATVMALVAGLTFRKRRAY